MNYKDKLQVNRKSGEEVLAYLQRTYTLSETTDQNMLDCVSDNVMMNQPYAEKLLKNATPIPRVFYLENIGEGAKFYIDENKDTFEMDEEIITRIIVGVDLVSGYFFVEGSSLLWDELNAFQGLDEKDLDNYVCVALYIESLKRCKQFKEEAK